MIYWFLGGCFAWTLIEYGMHNWNGHLLKGRTRFSREHLKHHVTKDYFSPFHAKVALAVTVSALITGVGSLIIGFESAACLGVGVASGYSFYEYVHWSTHMMKPLSGYGRWTRRHHFSHHFTDARYNHGVTTPIWDIAFGTYRSPARIKVPRKFALKWLLEDDGEIRQEFALDYYLTNRRARTGGAVAEQGA
jgi:4-hydroxysphinganine ceramide fatty acyl 2-hydroxylase